MIKHIENNEFDNVLVLDLLNALNDSTRQQVLMLFEKKCEYCVNEIAQQFKLSRPTVSHHLNLMKRAKLLKSRKDGKEVYYSLNKEYVVNVLESLVNLLKGCC